MTSEKPQLSEERPGRKIDRPEERIGKQVTHSTAFLALQAGRRADFWKLTALAMSVFCLLVSFCLVKTARSDEKIFVLDPAGNVLSGPAEPLARSRAFFTLTALYCTNAALQRSPEGFDLYELLKLYYTPRAIQTLDEDWQRQKDDAIARHLQQKPLIDSIGEPVTAGSAKIVEVRGRLVSAGAYAGHSFYEEPSFRLLLTFVKNPDLGKAAAYPWICEDFDLLRKQQEE